MLYTMSEPTNLSDPWLSDWSEPLTIVDSRVDGVQPHGPGFDDVTHAWQDAEDPGAWFFAGQSTAAGYPEYLQLWRSKQGDNWAAGFTSLGNLLPKPRLGGIANVPDFWRRTQTNFGADFLHFGDNQYYMGNYTRAGAGFGNTTFVPMTPPQSFGNTGEESHGFFDSSTQRFIWYGCVNSGQVPAQPGVPSWDGYVRTPSRAYHTIPRVHFVAHHPARTSPSRAYTL